MLDCDAFKEEHKSVLRLAAVSGNTSKSMLLKRGIDIEDVEDAATVLGKLPLPLTAEELIEDAFRPQDQRATPFPVKRFGDGTIGVYYSALEKVTCKKELAFHLNTSFIEMHEKNFSYDRVYSLVECNYSGTTVDLRGQEINNPDLVSETEAGYPFCQRLALKAVKRRIAGFFTASARHDGGTCVPVFARSALSNPSIRCEVTLQVTVAGAEFNPKNLPI